MTKTKNSQAGSTLLSQIASTAGLSAKQSASLRTWLAEQLVQHAYAKLGQGGHTLNQVPLRQVFVDLPVAEHALDSRERGERKLFLAGFLKSRPIDLKKHCSFISVVSEDVELELQNSVAELRAVVGQSRPAGERFSATLLVGGPGQGKSTLGQVACQLNRAALLLEHEDELFSVHQEVLRSFSVKKKGESYIRPPTRPLVPLQISLPEFVSWLGKTPNRTCSTPALVAYACDLPSAKTSKLSADTLYAVICHYPSLIVLDGFDEVGAQQDRAQIVQAAQELLAGLAEHDAAAQLLATTRPQGYGGELAQVGVDLTTYHLVPLRRDEALDYAQRLLSAKINSVDERAQAMSRLTEAANDPATERLLTSPLQVTIFAALVQQIGRAPRERWNLFFRFFSYTYEREVERGTYASKLLATFRVQIERIHARVGLLLQVEAERVGGASARMSRRRLEEVIDAVLAEDGFSTTERTGLVFEIAQAAEQRLVFLVEAEPENFGFDIRSLQEFMAAWALSSGRETEVEARLQQIARGAMFKNVFLFLASKLYSEGSPLREVLVSKIFPSLNTDAGVSAKLSLAGASLALDTLEEGAALSQPRHTRALLECAIELLVLPATPDHLRLARVTTGENLRPLRAAIELAIRGLPGGEKYDRNSAWICLIELINKSDGWAAAFGDANWPLLADPLPLLNAAVRVDLEVGSWLLNKLEQIADQVSPAEFVWLKPRISEGEAAGTWTGWFASSIYLKDKWATNAPFTDMARLRAPSRTIPSFPIDRPLPRPWIAWLSIVEYERSPSAHLLSKALKALAQQNMLWHGQRLSQFFSWPLALCLTAAQSKSDLARMAKALDSGALGDIGDWLAAEENWKTSEVHFESVFAEPQGFPWDLATLRHRPPVGAIPWWMVRGSTKSVKAPAVERAFAVAADAIGRAKKSPIRGRLIDICFDRYMQLRPSSPSCHTVPIDAWTLSLNHSIYGIVPRPLQMDRARWLSLLDRAEKQRLRSPVNPNALLKAEVEDINHPAILRFCIGAFTARGFTRTEWPDALRRVVEIFSDNPALAQHHRDYLQVIRFVLGDPHICGDELAKRLGGSDDSYVLLGVIQAVRFAAVSMQQKEDFLLSLYNVLYESSSYRKPLLNQAKLLLQSASSDLGVPPHWARLLLPLPAPPVEDAHATGDALLSTAPVAVESLSIRNVAGIASLDISFPSPQDGKGQWVVLIGPNGVGKTTILRCVALALRNAADPSIWPRNAFSRRWQTVRNPSESERDAEIVIKLGGRLSQATHLRTGPSGVFVVQAPVHTRASFVPIFAYGCKRGRYLSLQLGEALFTPEGGPEIATLFDDQAGLIDPEDWLIRLDGDITKSEKSQNLFNVVSRAIVQMLDLESISVRNMAVWVKERGRPEIPFNCLSDGYLSSSSWLLDLIARWTALSDEQSLLFGDNILEEMTGLVLVDEIDLHLHPRRQLEVIGRLKKVLPKLSFLVTTHNPMTLVGANASEIWQLKVVEGNVTAQHGVDSPIGMTGGQLYKQYFELADTFPNEIGRDFKRYAFLSGYALRDDDEEAELVTLKAKLALLGLEPQWEIVPRQVLPSDRY